MTTPDAWRTAHDFVGPNRDCDLCGLGSGAECHHGVSRPPRELNKDEHLARVKADAAALAVTLRDASDAGVSHALILPQLVLVFKDAFGEMPQGFQMPSFT